jgi:hypothetical protein
MIELYFFKIHMWAIIPFKIRSVECVLTKEKIWIRETDSLVERQDPVRTQRLRKPPASQRER